ncbi:tetratricopeptide repeat protein [bacterium]|nr:tetratricopeptide repeat protein [bacterium]
MRTFLILFFIFFTADCFCEEPFAARNFYNVSVFNFYNETGDEKFDVLQYSIREKLHNELKKSDKFNLVSPKKINDRILKRNLDIRNNLKQPRILQYIGGLVNSDILIAGEFVFDKDLLTIRTYLIDAVEGRLMRHYRYSGQLQQIDVIIKRVVSEIDSDTDTWRKIGGFTQKNSLAHHIGEMVAQNEEDQSENNSTYASRKINIPRLFFTTLNYPLNFKLQCIKEINNLLNQNIANSKLKNWIGWVYFWLGEKSYTENDTAKAFKYWDKTLELIPENEFFYMRIARAYTSLKQYDEAKQMYFSCIHINPDNIKAYTEISNIYFEQKIYNLAVFYLGLAIERAPAERNLYLQLAQAYILSKHYDKAVSILEKGLKIFPGNIKMNNMLKRCNRQITVTQPAFNNN